MFNNLGWPEIIVLVLLALFIFGPDRLPKVARDGARTLRRVREMAREATQDFREQLGPDVELEDLHPKKLLRKHLLSETEEEELRKPFQKTLGEGDYRKVLQRMRAEAGLDPRAGAMDDADFDTSFLNSNHPMFGSGVDADGVSATGGRSNGQTGGRRRPRQDGAAATFDPDAT
ncbi:MAG: hypothetical protein DLM55_03725 [Acidimicrobiales bacterium]|nr:MAG: hypothetical protein DLM55_03725 [Acidimicrobiales bacterium]